jgi:hypothetical protein
MTIALLGKNLTTSLGVIVNLVDDQVGIRLAIFCRGNEGLTSDSLLGMSPTPAVRLLMDELLLVVTIGATRIPDFANREIALGQRNLLDLGIGTSCHQGNGNKTQNDRTQHGSDLSLGFTKSRVTFLSSLYLILKRK